MIIIRKQKIYDTLGPGEKRKFQTKNLPYFTACINEDKPSVIKMNK